MGWTEHAWTLCPTKSLSAVRLLRSILVFEAAIRVEQIKALYRSPAIMLVSPFNASFLAVVLCKLIRRGSYYFGSDCSALLLARATSIGHAICGQRQKPA